MLTGIVELREFLKNSFATASISRSRNQAVIDHYLDHCVSEASREYYRNHPAYVSLPAPYYPHVKQEIEDTKTIAFVMPSSKQQKILTARDLSLLIRKIGDLEETAKRRLSNAPFWAWDVKKTARAEISSCRTDMLCAVHAQEDLKALTSIAVEARWQEVSAAYEKASDALEAVRALEEQEDFIAEASVCLDREVVVDGEVSAIYVDLPEKGGDWPNLTTSLRHAFDCERQIMASQRKRDAMEEAAFCAVFKMDRKELLTRLTIGMPGAYEITIHGVDAQRTLDRIDVCLQDAERNVNARFFVFPQQGNFGIEHLSAKPKGCGLGRTLMRNAFSVCDDMGIKTAETFAGYRDGARFWLKLFGIHPEGADVGGDMLGRGCDWYIGSKEFRYWLESVSDSMRRRADSGTEGADAVLRKVEELRHMKCDVAMLDALFAATESCEGQRLVDRLEGKKVHALYDFSNPAHQRRRAVFIDGAQVDMGAYAKAMSTEAAPFMAPAIT